MSAQLVAPDCEDDLIELAHALVEEFTRAGLTCACAESCTGGLVSSAITAIPGSSAVFRGAVVSYDPEVKHDVLAVPQQIIDDPSVGVVSSECARAMCLGALQVLGAQVAVSITGIAGPGGAEPGKPVGTVWFGITGPAGTFTHVKTFPGDRNKVRSQAVREALVLLRGAIVNL